MSIAIRTVLPEEAYEYTACHIACWRSAYKGIISDDFLDNMLANQKMIAKEWMQILGEPSDYKFFCAVLERKIVGRLILCKSQDEDKPASGQINAFYLLEQCWHKGYGRQMMDYAIITLKRMGYHEIILWVLEENIRARRFYEKCGFLFNGAKKEIVIGKPLAAIRYAINLQK
jgi:GNAT superfamily N-acetyltransferase